MRGLAEFPVAYAHRGFSEDGAENSIAAFQAAVDLGYRYLETDSRVTADGLAVAFHDYALDRLTNHTGRLSDHTWHEVSRARIVGREPIPLLEDVLATFDFTEINIDVKSNTAIGPTLDAVRRTNAWHRVRLTAFSHSRVVSLRRAAGPAVSSGLSPREILALKAGDPRGGLAIATGLDCAAQVPSGPRWLRLVDPSFIAKAHARSIPVHVWTINSRTEMVRLLDLGVDGIMTDRADVLRDLLQERGQWHP
jgi:glycerophosphoryl diester phosphodiesterase